MQYAINAFKNLYYDYWDLATSSGQDSTKRNIPFI